MLSDKKALFFMDWDEFECLSWVEPKSEPNQEPEQNDNQALKQNDQAPKQDVLIKQEPG
jgi:hypothetical protein